jgi:hypothetical protein
MSKSRTLQCFLDLKLPDNTRQYYQNYQVAPLTYRGISHPFLNFEFTTYPEGALELGNDDAKIIIVATDALRASVRLLDGLRKTIVRADHLILEYPSIPPYIVRAVISHTNFADGGVIDFSLRTPTSAIEGANTTKFFNSGETPIVPSYRPVL